MDFTKEGLAKSGFQGFMSVSALRRSDCAGVPEGSGVYVVLAPDSSTVFFLDTSPGGHFKGRDPTVSREVLRSRWVPDAEVLYIGRASRTDKANLRKRLRKFLSFGAGQPVGHWGGRLIWQIAGSDALVIAWRACADYKRAEAGALDTFERQYGALPFANLRREFAG